MKHYTFRLTAYVTLQYTFLASEVEPDADGSDSDVIPTDAALRVLEEELAEAFGNSHAIDTIDLDVDSIDLLGINESSL